MKPPERQERENKRTRQFVAVIGLLFIGLIGVWGMGATAFERYRPVDMLRLLASGACFGAAIVIIVGLVRRPRGV
jgi:hypothetical protein